MFKVGNCLLSERLHEAGMTQQQLADKVQMDRQRINDWVHNRVQMTYRHARVVSWVLGCSMESLYDFTVGDDPEKSERQ